MHLLLCERRLTPTKVGDYLGSMREGFPGPRPHHPWQGRRVPRGPIHRTGLLFHDPPAPAPDTAIEVVVEGGEVRMSLPEKARFDIRIPGTLLQESEWIGIPRRRVEIPGDIEVIEGRRNPHEVVKDVASRREPANDVRLLTVESDHLFRTEPPEVEAMGGIGLGDCLERWIDFIERAVLLAPEDRAPGTIQLRDMSVAILEPGSECEARIPGK